MQRATEGARALNQLVAQRWGGGRGSKCEGEFRRLSAVAGYILLLQSVFRLKN